MVHSDEVLDRSWMEQNVKVEVLQVDSLSDDTLRKNITMTTKTGEVVETGLCLSPYIEIEHSKCLVEKRYLNKTYLEMMNGIFSESELFKVAENNTVQVSELRYGLGGVCLVSPTASIFCRSFKNKMVCLYVDGVPIFRDYYVLLNNRHRVAMIYEKASSKFEVLNLHKRYIIEDERCLLRTGSGALQDGVYMWRTDGLYEV